MNSGSERERENWPEICQEIVDPSGNVQRQKISRYSKTSSYRVYIYLYEPFSLFHYTESSLLFPRMYSTTEHSVYMNMILCVYLCIPYDCMYRFKCSLRATREKEATGGTVRDGRENMTHFLAKGNGSNIHWYV